MRAYPDSNFFLCLCPVLLFLFPSGVARAADVSLKEYVLKEYPPAVSRLENFYSRSSFRASGVLQIMSKRTGTREYQVEMANSGDSHKAEFKLMSNGSKAKRLGKRVYSENSNYLFAITKEAEGSPWNLRELRVSGERHSKSPNYSLFSSKSYYIFERYLMAPCSLYGDRMSLVLTNPTFVLDDASESFEEKDRIIKIVFRFKSDNTNKKEMPRYVSLSVLPEQGWAIRRYEEKRPSGRVFWSEIEYGPSQEGVPIPKHVHHHQAVIDYDFTFDKFVLGTIPGGEFALSAYGIPELGRPTRRRFADNAAIWLIAAAVVALGIAFLLRYYNRKYRN